MRNKVIKTEKGFAVIVDSDQVNYIKSFLAKQFSEMDISVADCISALSCFAVDLAYVSKIEKPHFLTNISEHWERLDTNDDLRQIRENESPCDYCD